MTKEKEQILFRNTSYQNKLSGVLKAIESLIMNSLKRDKEHIKFFHCNDIAKNNK